ncbi:outer membrane protein assembly factor BamA [Oceaniovalibus sp. ACAM 378]|uniref:outer membrane protein assembly factor BamA n=1 Tax=Oceaniovalibus sp. ACAM 378 TaxID=2599923 RepID=UPI0011D57A39|nr:outer membrane protein assembly factor BamA [Oceaniovalibus sp. ACAM 378]TYB89691.1 outer membrane protein assembly factor BamA [Oceaniovalibus sp. ACAM 378]
MGIVNTGVRRRAQTATWIKGFCLVFLLALGGFAGLSASPAQAQAFQFNSVTIEGNQRIEPGTILSYAAISRGEAVSGAELNDAYQRIVNSGLFETVELVPGGSTLVIRVKEWPTINRINIEGNARIKDEPLLTLVKSQPRRVYNPTVAEQDAASMVEMYEARGRLAATITPKIIRRSDNRVDLVFEVVEGKVVEIERLSFVGNRSFSDNRLRRVLETKQAGLLRSVIQRDTFVADRLELDKQLLRDFYATRGFIDFQTLSVNSEFSRERNAFFVTFSVQEGQAYKFGEISASSVLPGVDAQEFLGVTKTRVGQTYSPVALENDINRMERLALKKGLTFIRVTPQVNRDDRNLILNIDYVIERGPRIFVERIDIEGNQTTLDRVIRRQFDSVEGDPFNPRQIRQAAERIRALGYFGTADVNTREGTAPDQVVVGVNVEEQPTGSLSFGGSYSADSGAGLNVSFSERNFLGRGQTLSFSVTSGTDSTSSNFTFIEPAILGRDLAFSFRAFYSVTEQDNSFYDTRVVGVSPGLDFPVSEFGRLGVRYSGSKDTILNVDAGTDDGTPTGKPLNSPILLDEVGSKETSSLGYTYTYDTRRGGLSPNTGILLQFGQDFAGLGGDTKYVKSTAKAIVQTKVMNEEVTLRATVEGGAVHSLNGNTTRLTDRYFLGPNLLRGFSSRGVGPRDLETVNQDVLGGNMYAVSRLEAEFPVGLPEEYGISGGVFLDAGSVWSLDNTAGAGGVEVDDAFKLRVAAGVSVFWDTPIGPLRFNFSKALKKEDYDDEQNFNLTISTQF